MGFPYIVSRILILPYFPYFALGVLLYLYFIRRTFRWGTEGVLSAGALLAVALVDSPTRVLWTCAFLIIFVFVAFRWSATFPVRALVGIGIISYPLYLLHETIGWAVIHRLEAVAVGTNFAIAIACGTALILACLLHFTVEGPAMRSIRRAWRRSSRSAHPATIKNRQRWIGVPVLIGMMVLLGNRLTLHA